MAKWSLILLCFSMASAIGGGLYEQIVLTPLWSRSPPSSFAIIQPVAGVPLQNFWIPVHAAITIFIVLSLFLTWRQIRVGACLLSDLALMSACAFGVLCSSSRRCSSFNRCLLILLHLPSCWRKSLGGPFGPGSESLSTLFHSFVSCWLFFGWVVILNEH